MENEQTTPLTLRPVPPYRRMGCVIHMAAWTVLLGLPFFFTGREAEAWTVESFLRHIIVPCSFMLVFYVNYFLLVRSFLFARQPGRFLLSNLLLIVVAMLAVHLLMQLLPPPLHAGPPREREWKDIVMFFFGNTCLYALVAGLSVAIRMTGSWYETESLRKELEKSRAEAELKNLKSQLNPHFLFNTLNNIYSLIAFSPERAQDAVHDLSRLLRYVLYESSQPLVPLEKELDFLRNYIELMRIRLPQSVALETDIRVAEPGREIAPLLFISLVENAFKHGVSSSAPSFIHIAISQQGNLLTCSIRNSFFPKETKRDHSGSGIGLVNLRKRLELLYPDRFVFRQDRDGDCFDTLLTITLSPLNTD